MNPPPSDRVTFCGQCGNEVAPEAKFCQSCGHELSEAVPPTPVPTGPVEVSVGGTLEVKQKTRIGCFGKTLIVLLGLGALLAGFALIGILVDTDDGTPPATTGPPGTTGLPGTTGPPAATEPPTTSVSKGLGSKDATRDVVDLTCRGPNASGVTEVDITVRNNSSKTSDYLIEVSAESVTGDESYDWTIFVMKYVEPEQMVTESSRLYDTKAGVVCQLRKVQRLASN